MLSVFIDTILICSATAFMLLCSGVEPTSKLQECRGFRQRLPARLAVSVRSLLRSHLPVCLYNADRKLLLCGNGAEIPLRQKTAESSDQYISYYRRRIVLAGATMEFSIVWNTADVLMGLMALINLPVILILCKPAIQAMNDYTKQKKAGKDPVFKAADIQLKDKTDFWN